MISSFRTTGIAAIIAILTLSTAQAADPDRPPSLKTIAVPEPSNLAEFVANKQQAIALGKALFWEMRVGSDGITACASCHFNAGADSRSKNQINPNTQAVNQDGSPTPDLGFDFGPNGQLVSTDFSFRQLSDNLNRGSEAVFDSNDTVSSQGVFAAKFIKTEPGKTADITSFVPDKDGFVFGNQNLRRVEPRNTPSVINAVFNYRNFYDGRAQHEFNGVNIWGNRDPEAKVFRAINQQLEAVKLSIDNASLASQAVGSPISDFEMSATGRTFPDVGRKLLNMRPLALQQVHINDSVLGSYSRFPDKGLKAKSYADMVKAAFQPQWWNSNKTIKGAQSMPFFANDRHHGHNSNNYSLMEYNFSLFFGLAVQLYEATLVSDDTPYDRFMAGEANAVSDAAIRGVDVFRSQTRGRCINCHEGAELTGASVTRVKASPLRIREEQVLDRGFNNIGVRLTVEDIGIGGTDPFGNPLANIRRTATVPNCANSLPCPIVADGFMKVPGLRNVELTAPYFHNGGTLTLPGVLDFYSRGGDYPVLKQLDGSGIAHLNVLISTGQEKQDLAAFLLSLTDERVRLQKAPFDHPQLFVTNGHKVEGNKLGNAKDSFMEIRAVGSDGRQPLKKFLQ